MQNMLDKVIDPALGRLNHIERFRALMAGKAVDRLPRWEWAMWWDETVERWQNEGLPFGPNQIFEITEYFGLDPYKQFWFSTTDPTIDAVQHHVEGDVANMADYERRLPNLFFGHDQAIADMAPWAERQAKGNAVVWATLEGFFWFARTLLGFDRMMLAYIEQPELLHRISQDLLDYNLSLLDKLEKNCPPTFITLAEDMSYNKGPMISEGVFDEFLAPYYRKLTERLRAMDTLLIVDTDGDVTMMIPWLARVGVNGVLPLERQAGVDGMEVRKLYPDFFLVGHYNKRVMHLGEDAMREEFERLVPLMQAGRFIPSVDHQTPPDVSMEQYRIFRRLLDEYTDERLR